MGTQAIILASLRGAHLLVLASLVGTLASLTLVAPAGLREAGGAGVSVRRTLVGLARWSDVLALLISVGWLYVESATIAGTVTIGDTLAAMVTVGRVTQFGHVVLLRVVLLLSAFPLLGKHGWGLWVALQPRRLVRHHLRPDRAAEARHFPAAAVACGGQSVRADSTAS